jgi:hypothetical protein
MASTVYAALAIALIVGGAILAADLGGIAERLVYVLRRDSEDMLARTRRWRVMGMTYVIAGALLLIIALLSH